MKNCLSLFSIFLSVFVLLSSCTNLLDDDKSASGQISMSFPARNVRTAENSEVLNYKFLITNRNTQEKKK